jgi:exonuclease III
MTYNSQFLPFPESTDNDYFDEDGNPLSNVQRATLLADRILQTGLEIVMLNEVFDEDARKALVDALKTTFPYYVAYIGNDSDPSDSGLMLFSRYPFEKVKLDDRHIYECGDVEVGQNGVTSECPGEVLGFVEFDCEVADSQSDCLASKGAGLVRIRLPMQESLTVVFTHPRASYGADLDNSLYGPDGLPCAKKLERQKALEQIEKLVRDATEEYEGDPYDAKVVVAGDLNIDGNPHHGQNSACLDAEWADAFSSSGVVAFTSCADLPNQTCINERRVLFDAWAFTTSPDDLGRTTAFDFTTDLAAPDLLGQGDRLDYILVRGPSTPTASDLMVPQHTAIAYAVGGDLGELSDHLPVSANLLLPGQDVQVHHSTPSDAASLNVPASGFASIPMEIKHRGQMQWTVLNGKPGTYTVRSPSQGEPIAFQVYEPTDLSRPLEPRRAGRDGGWVYVMTSPPYFIRTYVTYPFEPGVHDRESTTAYTVSAKRHDCTSAFEPCILTAGEKGDGVVEVTWPAGQPVNSEDAMWFEFYADDPVEQKTPTFHEFEVYVDEDMSLVGLPDFEFKVVDFDTQTPLPDIEWETTVWEFLHKGQRADGVHGKPNSTPSFANHLLMVIRPMNALAWGDTPVKVFHGTNLTYFKPLTIEVLQENDDSAHDELRIYMKPENTDLFYNSVTDFDLYVHAHKFTALPQIDEREDGGSAWPAGSLGSLKLTEQLPLLMLEDDDEDGEDEPGDFLFAQPKPSASWATDNKRALKILKTDVTDAHLKWNFSNNMTLETDDMDYRYVFTFDISHTPPCFTTCE